MMNHEEWRKVEDLLDAALALEPPERLNFLERIGEPELRREVESLLVCEQKAGNFLATPAIAFSSDFFADVDGRDARDGQTIGHYRVIREVGRGGMGAVYLAERADGVFEQQVALKIVRGNFAGSELVRRFRRERQILASLNHPNIARLLDGGVSQDGEPFLAMEYVEGLRIDDYCDDRRLSVDERLRLFLIVCQAVAYAHQHLIVHRDIKPSNLLVTKEGVPKLLDFGIAKLLDAEHASEHTQTELRAFTPEYASPEQVQGLQITTASDVYSLGVLLEELLLDSSERKRAPLLFEQTTLPKKTGETNLPAADTKENQRATVKSRKPLSVELRRIVEMARREEPARRYASTAQFAEDIQRYLDGLPVRAQKDSFTYRAGKFVRRHKAGVAAAALLLLTLVSGIIATAWQARRATREARIAADERDRAQRRFTDVRKLANSLLFEITPKIERLEGSTAAREVLVTRALEYLDSLAQEAGDDLQLQSELAAAYEKIASLQGEESRPNLGDFDGAITSYVKAQAIRRKLLPALPADVENRRRLAENLRLQAKIQLSQRNEFARALEHYAEALQIYEMLTRENPDSLKLQIASLEMRLEQSQSYGDNFQYAEAIPPLRQTIGKLEELRQRNPNDPEVLRVLAKGLAYLGHDLAWNNQPAEAEAEMTRAITIAESLVAANPTNANLRQGLWATYYFGSGIYEGIDNARSFALSEKALKVVEETIALDKANVQARVNLAGNLSYLGTLSANLGKSGAALTYLENSARVWAELIEKDPHNTRYNRGLAISYQYLGDARYKQRDPVGALSEYEKAADIHRKISAADPSNLETLRDTAVARKSIALVHDDLARTASADKRHALLQTAKENYQQALDILLKLQSNNALAEPDRKFLEEMQAAVRK